MRQADREGVASATSELPDGLFKDQEAAWQVTVGGHLIAALHAIPTDERHDALKRIVDDALAVLGTAEAQGPT